MFSYNSRIQLEINIKMKLKVINRKYVSFWKVCCIFLIGQKIQNNSKKKNVEFSDIGLLHTEKY